MTGEEAYWAGLGPEEEVIDVGGSDGYLSASRSHPWAPPAPGWIAGSDEPVPMPAEREAQKEMEEYLYNRDERLKKEFPVHLL